MATDRGNPRPTTRARPPAPDHPRPTGSPTAGASRRGATPSQAATRWQPLVGNRAPFVETRARPGRRRPEHPGVAERHAGTTVSSLDGESDRERARDGAWDSVVDLERRIGQRLLGYAIRLGVDPDRAPDLVPEALIRSWRELGRGTPDRLAGGVDVSDVVAPGHCRAPPGPSDRAHGLAGVVPVVLRRFVGGAPEPVVMPGTDPAWSPDGSRVAVAAGAQGGTGTSSSRTTPVPH